VILKTIEETYLFFFVNLFSIFQIGIDKVFDAAMMMMMAEQQQLSVE
jgi:hypothetical protein